MSCPAPRTRPLAGTDGGMYHYPPCSLLGTSTVEVNLD